MIFNPVYSNVLPYGDATPNRHGFYLQSEVNYKVIRFWEGAVIEKIALDAPQLDILDFTKEFH